MNYLKVIIAIIVIIVLSVLFYFFFYFQKAKYVPKVPTGIILVPPRATESKDTDYRPQIKLLENISEKNVVVPVGFDTSENWLSGAEIDDFIINYADLIIVEYFPPIMERYGLEEQILVNKTFNKLLDRLDQHKSKIIAISLGSDNNGKWGYWYSLISADFHFKKYRDDVMTIAHERGYKILWGIGTISTGPLIPIREGGFPISGINRSITWDDIKSAIDENIESGVDFPSIQYYPTHSEMRTEKQEVENLQSILRYIRSKNIDPILFEFGVGQSDPRFDIVLYARLLKEMLIQEKISMSWFYTIYDHRNGLYWGNEVWNPVRYVFYPK